jgi:hypothetical protein
MGTLPQKGGPRAPGPVLVDPLVCLLFSRTGDFLHPAFLPIPFELDPAWTPTNRDVFSLEHQAEVRSRWMADHGMTIGTIHVKYFALPELRIGIADWPNHLFRERFSESQRGVDLATLDVEDGRMSEWIEGGHFVFFWGTDFWMNPDGTISSS